MAHLSEDAALLQAFHEGMDVHRATASRGVWRAAGSGQQRAAPLRQGHQLRPDLRHERFGLARNLGIDNTAAKNYIERYFQRFEGVKRYMDETRQLGQEQGYVETVFGRRLYLPEINSTQRPAPPGGAERAAINAPMQGTAADLIKLSMNAVQQVLDASARHAMIMQVHDELVFEVPEAEVDWVRAELPAPDGGRGRAQGAAAGRGGRGPELGQGSLTPAWAQAHPAIFSPTTAPRRWPSRFS
jgi:DNA polymerase-1